MNKEMLLLIYCTDNSPTNLRSRLLADLCKEIANQRSYGTPTQAMLATLSVLPIQLKLWQKGYDLKISTASEWNENWRRLKNWKT